MRAPEDVLPTVWLDGAYAPAATARVSVFDRGFLMADGAFETMHVKGGAILALEAHAARLWRAAEFLAIRLPWDAAGLRAGLAGLLQRNGLASPGSPEAALRVTMSRGASMTGPPTVVAFLRQVGAAQARRRAEGLNLHTLPLPGRGSAEMARHKTLSYLPSALGSVWLAGRTDDPRAEGLFVSEQGCVLEGMATNIAIVESGRLVTPPIASGVLAGTARDLVLRMAAEAGMGPLEEEIPRERLTRADEVLAMASTLHVAPVVSLDGQPVGGGRPGPVTRTLQAAFEAAVDEDVRAWHAAG
ncbi:MAG: aminotransferase class IV [Deltaproteobacteria bacterium]|nr:aminotransferase class IV [Deltaproteobacteria bacterium]MCB9788802.1 aminotransferase class IV [Deltaproteobacteria bacterium]